MRYLLLMNFMSILFLGNILVVQKVDIHLEEGKDKEITYQGYSELHFYLGIEIGVQDEKKEGKDKLYRLVWHENVH